jgi:hypothetical protein
MNNKTKVFMTLGLILLVIPSMNAAPAGYGEQWRPMGREISSVFCSDASGRIFYGSTSSTKRMPIPGIDGTRGLSSSIWVYNPSDGTHGKFYDAADHSSDPYQINSAAGIAIDISSADPIYYIADNQPDDEYQSGGIWRGEDINEDGDINDAGEVVMVTAYNDIIYVSNVIVDTSSGHTELFASNSAGTAGSVMVYRLYDANDNGDFKDSGEVQNYFAAASADWVYTGSLAFNNTITTQIFLNDSGGSIYLLDDTNDDGILDTWNLYASLPVMGGVDLDVDPDGDIFVTASEFMGDHKLFEIEQGSPPVVTEFADLSAFAGWTGTMTFGAGTVFEPDNFDTSLYMTFSTTNYLDPTYLKVYGNVFVPSMDLLGIVLACAVLGLFMLRR